MLSRGRGFGRSHFKSVVFWGQIFKVMVSKNKGTGAPGATSEYSRLNLLINVNDKCIKKLFGRLHIMTVTPLLTPPDNPVEPLLIVWLYWLLRQRACYFQGFHPVSPNSRFAQFLFCPIYSTQFAQFPGIGRIGNCANQELGETGGYPFKCSEYLLTFYFLCRFQNIVLTYLYMKTVLLYNCGF